MVELRVPLVSIPILWCDNQGVVSLAANPVLHSKIKHVTLDVHFVCERVLAKQLQVCFIPSAIQPTDAPILLNVQLMLLSLREMLI